MNEMIHTAAQALLTVAIWATVLTIALAVCVVVGAVLRACVPTLVGVLVRLGVIE